MFFLITKTNEEIRRSENRIALRRAKRKLPKSDSLRIVSGDTLSKAIKAEEKALKEAAKKAEVKPSKKAKAKKEVKINKKAVKKAVSKHTAEVKKASNKKVVKTDKPEAGSKVAKVVEATSKKEEDVLFQA